MRPTFATLPLALLLPLAACNSEPEVSATNATVAEVAKEVREAGGSGSFVRPGKWESRIAFVEMNIPGAPPTAQSALRAMNERSPVSSSCLTAEQAKRPKEDFFAGANKNCRYDHFTMGDGKIDAAMQCATGEMRQTIAMQGTYSPDTYAMQMTMKTDGMPGAAEGMTMRMRINAKRIGDCTEQQSG